MKKLANNYAFIDSQNLNLGVRSLGWILDFKRFYVYLEEKYSVKRAYIFIGYVPENWKLYNFLRESGYICVFKPTVFTKSGLTKGNCDAELVLQSMIDYPKYDKAVVVSGDGDFYCLAKYLVEKGKLEAVIVPARSRFSALLNFRILRPYLKFLDNLKDSLEFNKEKTP